MVFFPTATYLLILFGAFSCSLNLTESLNYSLCESLIKYFKASKSVKSTTAATTTETKIGK